MAIDKIFNNSSIDDLADNVLSEVDDFMLSVEKMQKRKVAGNVQLVIQALKKIDADIREKYDGVTTVIEKRVSTIKDGKDGQNGANGRDGKDGRPGRDGSIGPRGVDGLNGSNGRDGEDGVSVTNAFIDFDGSLVINLSDGQSLNVGEVVAPDLAEKIKVITNGGGTSQGVLDTLTSLQNQINLISSALVYKGTWNASTNTPALASGVGTANSFYIVSVAGTTTLNGISNWGVGDWATFNGTAWQRVEGGAAGNFTDLTVSGAATLSAGEANGVAFLNGSKVLSSSSFFTYDDSTGISLLRAFNQYGTTSFTGTTNIGTSVGTSTANPFFQFQGRNDWPLPQILRFQADYVSGAASGMGLTISSRVSDGTFQNRYQLLANGTAHIWSLGATGAEQMRLNSTGLELKGKLAAGYTDFSGIPTNGAAFAGSVGIGTSSPWSQLTVGSGGTANPPATVSFHANTVNQYRLKLTSTLFNTDTSWLGIGFGYSDNYMKAAIIAEAKDANGRANFHFALNDASSSANAGLSDSKMVLTYSGNLGLGVTPSAWYTSFGTKAFQFAASGSLQGLDVSSSDRRVALANNDFINSAGNNIYINTGHATKYQMSAGAHQWYTAPSGTAGDAITFTQAMTLDASGRLGIGTTSPTAKINVYESGSGDAAVRIGNAQNALTTDVGKQGSSSYGATSAGDSFLYSSGTLSIMSDNGGGIIKFSAGGNTERARITSGGDLLVGTTSAAFTGKIVTLQATSASDVFTAWNSATTGDNAFIGFYTEAGGTGRGSISYNRAGGLVAYNVTSDYRAKDISGPVTGSGALIDSTPVYMGKMKDATQERPMFIAHEVPAYAHTGEKDAVDADGNPVYQQMDASALVPVMWAEIQSLRQRLAAAGI